MYSSSIFMFDTESIKHPCIKRSLWIKKCPKKWEKYKKREDQRRKSKSPQINVTVDSKCFIWTKNNLVLKAILIVLSYVVVVFLFFLGGSQNSKYSKFQIFSRLGLKGGGHHISNFSHIQKSTKHSGGEGGGLKKIVDFFHILGHFLILRLH